MTSRSVLGRRSRSGKIGDLGLLRCVHASRAEAVADKTIDVDCVRLCMSVPQCIASSNQRVCDVCISFQKEVYFFSFVTIGASFGDTIRNTARSVQFRCRKSRLSSFQTPAASRASDSRQIFEKLGGRRSVGAIVDIGRRQALSIGVDSGLRACEIPRVGNACV